MAKMSQALLKWRGKQKRGAIMKPEKFNQIVAEQEAKGMSHERAVKVAGSAYWRTAKAMYRKRKKK